MNSGEFLDVERIVHALGVSSGQHVADLGCGSGFFTVALARAVGKKGKVTAVDVMQEPLESVHARAQALGLTNVQTVRADLEVLGGTKIADASQDLAVLKNILFQSQKKDSIVAEAARMLKPGGRLVIIDWAKGASGLGPPDELRVDAAHIQQLAQSAGLQKANDLATDQYHTGIVFTK